MDSILQRFLSQKDATFDAVTGIVSHYGEVESEYQALTTSAGLINLSQRGRICLLGADRAQFLHGQVTNNIKELQPGQGCYAALVTAKGKIESDLQVYCLEQELLLDFEHGLSEKVRTRLEKYVIADDVQVVDVEPYFQLISIQGPKAHDTLRSFGIEVPDAAPIRSIFKVVYGDFEIYVTHLPRFGSDGWDVFFPTEQTELFLNSLLERNEKVLWIGKTASEIARIEAGIPRYGIDMDESNLAPETGLERDAIQYNKGCYIGQEVIARIRTYGQVAKALRVLHFEGLTEPPAPRTRVLHNNKEVGYVTSSVRSPKLGKIVGMGYLRKEVNKPGNTVQVDGGEGSAVVVGQPATTSVFQPV